MRLLTALSILTFYLCPLAAQEWDEVTEESQKVCAQDIGDADEGWLGMATDMWGNTVFSSAPVTGVDDKARTGSVHVFQFDPVEDEWVQEQKLTASDAGHTDWFGGIAVAVHNDVAIVGAHRNDDDGENSGSAYVFRYNSDDSEWIEEQKLTASDGATEDLFGLGAAIYAEVAVVGSPSDDDDGANSGSAYVFTFDADSEEWTESQKLVASDAAAGDRFGHPVHIYNEVCAISASGNDDDGESSGAVYVFRYDPEEGEWTQEQILTASDADAGDRFGNSAALFEDVCVIGANLEGDESGDWYGAAYVFRYDSDEEAWMEEEKLVASDREEQQEFGASVSVLRNEIVVGGGSGAYMFSYDDGEWIETEKLIASDYSEKEIRFDSVALSGRGVVLGSPIFTEDECLYAYTRPSFLRGDADGSATVFATLDALYILEYGFLDGEAPGCMDAADVDDSGDVFPILDAICLLAYGFTAGDPPSDPGPDECGTDPTEDDLDCAIVSEVCL